MVAWYAFAGAPNKLVASRLNAFWKSLWLANRSSPHTTARPTMPIQKQIFWIRAYVSMPRVTTTLTKARTIKQLTKMPLWLLKKVATLDHPSVYARGRKNWTFRMLAYIGAQRNSVNHHPVIESTKPRDRKS